jgi:hypothetical protein
MIKIPEDPLGSLVMKGIDAEEAEVATTHLRTRQEDVADLTVGIVLQVQIVSRKDAIKAHAKMSAVQLDHQKDPAAHEIDPQRDQEKIALLKDVRPQIG